VHVLHHLHTDLHAGPESHQVCYEFSRNGDPSTYGFARHTPITSGMLRILEKWLRVIPRFVQYI
jgi:hypothetical protein